MTQEQLNQAIQNFEVGRDGTLQDLVELMNQDINNK